MTLEQRIEKLERSNLYWKRGCAVLGILWATLICMGQARISQDEISVNRLVVKGAQGTEQLSLGEQPNGFYGLVVSDSKGVPRMTLGLTQDQVSTFLTQTPKGAPGVVISTDEKSFSDLQIGDPQGRRVFYAPQ